MHMLKLYYKYPNSEFLNYQSCPVILSWIHLWILQSTCQPTQHYNWVKQLIFFLIFHVLYLKITVFTLLIPDYPSCHKPFRHQAANSGVSSSSKQKIIIAVLWRGNIAKSHLYPVQVTFWPEGATGLKVTRGETWAESRNPKARIISATVVPTKK